MDAKVYQTTDVMILAPRFHSEIQRLNSGMLFKRLTLSADESNTNSGQILLININCHSYNLIIIDI